MKKILLNIMQYKKIILKFLTDDHKIKYLIDILDTSHTLIDEHLLIKS